MPETKTSQEKPTGDHTPADKGLNYYPISDLQFDVLTIMYEKSKALQAYDKYIRDAKDNSELSSALETIRQDDKKHVELLKQYLGNC